MSSDQPFRLYYKVQLVILKCDSLFYDTVRFSVITKCDKCYYKVQQFCYKMRQVLQSATEQPRSRFKMTSGRATWGKYVSGIQVSVGYPTRVHNNVCRYPGTIPPPPDISAYCEHNLRQNHFISGIIFLGKSLMNSVSGRRYSSGHLDGVQSRTQISLCLTLKSEISASLGRERSGYEIRWCLQTPGHKHLKSLYPVFMPKQN